MTRRRLHLLRPHLLLCILLTLLPAAHAAKRVALVIGNGDYAFAALKNPANDAHDMAAVLKTLGFEVQQYQNLNQKKMHKAVRKFGKSLRGADIGLFYYAGHGMEVNDRNYLIPVGVDIESEDEVPYEAIDVGQVLAKMEAAGNPVNILVLDACRNNPLERSFRSGSRGLARMDAPVGSFLLYATAPGKVAADGEGRNGLFTRHLIENLRQPGLTLRDIALKTRVAVMEATGGKQVPWESTSLTRSVMLHAGLRLPEPRPVPAPSPAPAQRRSFEPEMVFIKGGEFEMGCVSGKGCYGDERVHRVRVGDFWMGKYEVTVGQYKACMRAGACRAPEEGYEKVSPSDRHPIQSISWNDAVAYAEWLSGETGKHYRLPTEAEWEYAARAGSRTAYPWGNKIGRNRANCDEECGDSYKYTAPVGSFSAYGGLYDMNGNVWEWTCSNYDKAYGGDEKRCVSKGDGGYREARGGSWRHVARGLRSAYRGSITLGDRGDDGGFRLLRQP